MEKRNIFLILISLLILIVSFSGATTIKQDINIPPQDWTQTFGGTAEDGGESIQQTTDGGYIITGYTFSFGAGASDVWLIKTDSNGNKIWDKTFGGSDWDQGLYVQQTSDGGFILTGYTDSFGTAEDNVWLIKTDENGNKIWDKTFGGDGIDEGRTVMQTSDGDYIICGVTGSFGAGSNDIWLIKTDANGNKIWDKTFGGSNDDYGYSLDITYDNNFILTGYTTSYGAGNGDVWLIKTDANGNKIWDKTFGDSDWDRGRSVRQTNDGGYIIAGSTFSYGSGNGDIWIIKTDSVGNKVWDVTRGGNGDDRGRCVRQTSDFGYIITGYRYSTDLQHNVLSLIKLDVNGNLHWNTTFSGNDSDRGLSVEQTTDNGYIITGYTKSYGAGDRDVWLIKTAAGNNPPYKPMTPSGSTNGEPGETYRYSSSTSDYDGDLIYYRFDWGDGTNSGWLGPYSSMAIARASHEWADKGTFQVKVQAMDDPNRDGDLSDGEESIWSDSLIVSMTKGKVKNPMFLNIFDKLLETFSGLKVIIQLVLNNYK